MLLSDDVVTARLICIEAGTTSNIGSVLVVTVNLCKLEVNLHLVVNVGTV